MAWSRLLIGLFALLGLAFAALVGQNLTNSRNRSRQRKTMGVLRTVMTCVEAYAVDHAAYPEATTIDELARLVEPTYIRDLPRTDGWGWPLDYRSSAPSSPPTSSAPPAPSAPSASAGSGTAESSPSRAPHCYVVRSPGRDGLFEQADPFTVKGGPTVGFDRDIVFASSTPSQWPEGSMRP